MIIKEMKSSREKVIQHALSPGSLAEYKEFIRKACIEEYVKGNEFAKVVLKSNVFLHDYIIEALEDWAKSERLTLTQSNPKDGTIRIDWDDWDDEEEEDGF